MTRLCFFTVTEKDLLIVWPRDVQRCPLVAALARAAGDAWPEHETAVFVRSKLPRRVLRYMRDIDLGRRVRPETFLVDLDDATLGVKDWKSDR